MNFKQVINKELLFEKEDKSASSLKVFYDINIKIENEEPDNSSSDNQVSTPAPVATPVDTAPVTPAPVATPTVAPVTAIPPTVKESVMTEEEVQKSVKGEISLTKDDADNIQTIDDLLDFLGDKKHKGEKLLDELTVEVITSLLGSQESMSTSDIIKKNDQIIINLAYGYKKDNSIGVKILKRRGVDSVSIMMLKDNEVLDSKFDEKMFNSQIVDFRNDWLNK